LLDFNQQLGYLGLFSCCFVDYCCITFELVFLVLSKISTTIATLMKIYTKKGDTGTTQLIGGLRVSKSHERIDAYGTVDELNSCIGSMSVLANDAKLTVFLQRVQDRLFTLGSALACEPAYQAMVLPDIEADDIVALEQAIDAMNEHLPELKNFVLPGGNASSAAAHVARCVCRRAERCVVGLQGDEAQPLDPLILQYLNRLSDYLFVLSRELLYVDAIDEVMWQPRVKKGR
jgi:cob(I)alamin adenosyltransferase